MKITSKHTTNDQLYILLSFPFMCWINYSMIGVEIFSICSFITIQNNCDMALFKVQIFLTKIIVIERVNGVD